MVKGVRQLSQRLVNTLKYVRSTARVGAAASVLSHSCKARCCRKGKGNYGRPEADQEISAG